MHFGNSHDSMDQNSLASVLSEGLKDAFRNVGSGRQTFYRAWWTFFELGALARPNGNQWKESVVELNDSCGKRPSERAHHVGVRPKMAYFTFKIEHAEDGIIETYKSRFVARGFMQVLAVNVLETFSPIVGCGTIRTVLAVNASQE